VQNRYIVYSSNTHFYFAAAATDSSIHVHAVVTFSFLLLTVPLIPFSL
jgi:hypothetical protein